MTDGTRLLTQESGPWHPIARFPTPREDPALFLITFVGAERVKRLFVDYPNQYQSRKPLQENIRHFSVFGAFEHFQSLCPTISFQNRQAVVSDWEKFEALGAACMCFASLPNSTDELASGKTLLNFTAELALGFLPNQLSTSPPTILVQKQIFPKSWLKMHVPVCFPPNVEFPDWMNDLGYLGQLHRTQNSESIDFCVQHKGNVVFNGEAKLRKIRVELDTFCSVVTKALGKPEGKFARVFFLVTTAIDRNTFGGITMLDPKSLCDAQLQPLENAIADEVMDASMAASAPKPRRLARVKAMQKSELEASIKRPATGVGTPAGQLQEWTRSGHVFFMRVWHDTNIVTCLPMFPGTSISDETRLLFITIAMEDLGKH